MTSQVRPAPRLRWLPRPRLTSMQREAVEGFLFISPWVIGFLVFTAGPLVASLYLSFTDWGLVGSPKLVGFKNYAAMANDRLFWQALKVTVLFSGVGVPLGLVAGFSVALVMNQNIRAIGLWRTIYYLPAVIGGVAVARLWQGVFNSKYGAINTALALIGIQGPSWLGDERWVLPALLIMSLWGVAGANMVIYLAGLQSIPTELYEAAMIDGAGAWRKLVHVTIPMMTPVILLRLVMGIIGSFQIFTQAFVMTKGGPGTATNVLVYYIYTTAFTFFRMGYAASVSWVLFLILFVITIIQWQGQKKWVSYM